jgi:hypothetical protein
MDPLTPDAEQEREVQRLAEKLGGGWRIEQGVMPVVVLTITEAQRLAYRLEARGAQPAR